jgi:prolipoprotein diacylglyceryltransferase
LNLFFDLRHLNAGFPSEISDHMRDVVFLVPVLLLLIGYWLNYVVYKMALKVYYRDPQKAGKILQYGGERMLREDYHDPFYQNNRNELEKMIQLRTCSLILILASIVLIIVLNFQHAAPQSPVKLPQILKTGLSLKHQYNDQIHHVGQCRSGMNVSAGLPEKVIRIVIIQE